MESTSTPQNESKQSFFGELFKFAFIALIIVLPIRLYVAQPFIVSGASMDPTFADKQYLIVDEISYRFTEVKRGDVIILRPPVDQKKYYIKRVIGLPGETVEIKNGIVTIKNSDHAEGFILNEPYVELENQTATTATFVLTPEQYFVMGDNRAASYDSRSWGPLDASKIIGRPFLRLLPFSTIEMFPGVEDNS